MGARQCGKQEPVHGGEALHAHLRTHAKKASIRQRRQQLALRERRTKQKRAHGGEELHAHLPAGEAPEGMDDQLHLAETASYG